MDGTAILYESTKWLSSAENMDQLITHINSIMYVKHRSLSYYCGCQQYGPS